MEVKDTRTRLLEGDLSAYAPKQWSINLPFRDYRVRVEDLIPALAGAIGKTSLAAAFAMAWTAGLGIEDPSFVVDNVRLEIVVASVFTLLCCAILNPSAGPPGTLALLVPLVPLMAATGVHPFPFAMLISFLGLVLTKSGLFLEIVRLNGTGAKAGVLILFGLLGIKDALSRLQIWTGDRGGGMFMALIVAGVLAYLLLLRLHAKWFVIPACAGIALIVSAIYGVFPAFETGIGLPIIDPSLWWNEKWGIGYGMTVKNIMRAAPFALLVLSMWPVDLLTIRAMQETNYPPGAKNAYLDINATFMVVMIRNLVGSVLGGAQTAAVWRSFMIPLAMVKRPIAGSALLLGVFGMVFGFLGFLIDLGIFPPLVWLVLMLGVFVPMLETGLSMVRKPGVLQASLACILIGIAINPVIGWSFAFLAENLGLFQHQGKTQRLTNKEKGLSIVIFVLTLYSYLATL